MLLLLLSANDGDNNDDDDDGGDSLYYGYDHHDDDDNYKNGRDGDNDTIDIVYIYTNKTHTAIITTFTPRL